MVIYILVYLHINIHIYMCICVYVYMCICVYVCVCVCVYVYGTNVYICIYYVILHKHRPT